MKKLFLLLAMVGLAFASCTTPDDGGQTGGAGGAGEFTFTVTNIGEYGATFTVAAKEETRTFYWNCLTKAEILEYGSTKDFMEEWHADTQKYVDNGSYTWEELLDTGSAEHTSTKLKPDTTYFLWAYGVDANGNCTSTDLSYYEFKTLPSTFDTNSWAGYWTLTPSKLFCEIISENTWTQVLVANEQNTTRTLEIVDGATEDESLAGYALVYGWDANIPGVPALGKYVGNTIELLGDEIVGADGEYLLTWLPIAVNVEDSEDFLYAGGIASWFTPYILTMNADGTVNVKGGTGLTTDGTNSYQAEAFKVEWVLGENLYTAMQAEDEMVYHPAGNTMTAVKAAAEDNGGAEPAPAKLSAKKNIKVMHKYANAKSAAMQFSSAVKMAKLAK